jgi:hypothetical protein
LRSALESCDLEIVTPSRAAISSAKHASVQLTRFVTGADRRGSATRKAACVFKGVGPGNGRVSKASTPKSDVEPHRMPDDLGWEPMSRE